MPVLFCYALLCSVVVPNGVLDVLLELFLVVCSLGLYFCTEAYLKILIQFFQKPFKLWFSLIFVKNYYELIISIADMSV